MKTKSIFISYIIFSSFIALYFVSDYFTESSLFGYSHLIDVGLLMKGVGLLTVGIFFFLFGAWLAKPFFKPINCVGADVKGSAVAFSKKNNFPIWQILVLMFIVTIYLIQLSAITSENWLPYPMGDRIFESKVSLIFLIFLGYMAYVGWGFKWSELARSFVIVIAILVLVIDASRSGLIPLLGLFFGAIKRKRIGWSIFALYLLYFGASYSIGARMHDGRLNSDFIFSYLFPDIEMIYLAISLVFDYIFSLSILNFCYMSFILMPDLSLGQLIAATNPLPSFIIGSGAGDALQLVNDVRAVGGPSELLLAGGAITLYAAFFLLGMFSAYVDSASKSPMYFLLQFIFFLVLIVFFQYSIRTSLRGFEFLLFLTFLMKNFNRFVIFRKRHSHSK